MDRKKPRLKLEIIIFHYEFLFFTICISVLRRNFVFLKPPASKGDTVHSSENVNEKVKLQIEESPIFLLVHIPHRTHDLVTLNVTCLVRKKVFLGFTLDPSLRRFHLKDESLALCLARTNAFCSIFLDYSVNV